MKLILVVAGLCYGALVSPVTGYAVVADNCEGISVCEFIEGNSETAILGEDDEVLECIFGQTGIVTDSNGFCDTPCDGRAVFNCTCASEAQKETGLEAEAYFDQIIGILALVMIFLVAFIHGFFERRYRKKTEIYKAELEKVKGDATKLDTAAVPKAPWTCCYLITYIVAISLMIVGFVRMSNILNRDYWVGCGTDGDGFFQVSEET